MQELAIMGQRGNLGALAGICEFWAPGEFH